MSAHPLLTEYLRLAYGCMACDGEVATSEVSCLRSIAVQMGQPVEEVDGELQVIGGEYAEDFEGVVDRAKAKICEGALQHPDIVMLVDMLVQLVEADGTILPSEVEYVRDLIGDLPLDRSALREDHPEWRSYLVDSFQIPSDTKRSAADTGFGGVRERPQHTYWVPKAPPE